MSNWSCVFKPEAKTWSEASEYCRSNYYDLVSFSSNKFDDIFFDREIPTWIGLHRDGASWKWSWGDSEYTNWLEGDLSVGSGCGSLSSMKKKTAPQSCDTLLPSLCIADNLVLVKEKRSWEEALEHCRGLRSSSNSNLRYDLLSLQPADNQDFIKTKVMQADTEEVWTGLRFLAGDWLWVNGADMLYTDLPFCPAPGQHCGILSKSNSSMETRDCSEGKNFLCYSYTPVV
uniref:C-type lectin domain-containing protein n=1 Tax=Xiphophorus maculatus TaxID=8083 RepID=A0A3B5RFK2_XIPMA